jgi:glutamate dehydrogenase
VLQHNALEGGQQRFDQWFADHELMITRWLSMLAELKSSDQQDYAIYTLAGKRLAEIAQDG